jgi:hypothetical protein
MCIRHLLLAFAVSPSSEARFAGKAGNSGFTSIDTDESGSFGKLRTSFGGWVTKRRS